MNDLTALDGSPLSTPLDGKVVLFVNVASRCGLTPQYTGLQALAAEARDDGLVVVGVPCNQFGAQEPGTPEQIAEFCSATYGVDFPILEKQDVNGPSRSPLYQMLVNSEAGGGGDIAWNFEKFLVDRNGVVRHRFSPQTAPSDAGLRSAIAELLAE